MKTNLAFSLFLLGICSTTGATPLLLPTILLSTTTVAIQAPLGGPDPLPSHVILTNNGNGNLKWTGTTTTTNGLPWLIVDPAAGNLPTSQETDLSIKVNVAGLGSGDHTGKVTIADPASTNVSVDINVTLTILSGPKISLTPGGTLVFSAPAGGSNPTPKTLTLQNIGGGTLEWTAVATTNPAATWLSIDASSGTLTAGATKTITVSVNTNLLPAGPYLGAVTVTGNTSNSPQKVDVNLSVNQGPEIEVAPAALTFEAPKDGPNPAAKTFILSNPGGAPLSWTSSDNAGWLAYSPDFATLGVGQSQTITVTVNTVGLGEGGYSGAIQIVATGVSPSGIVDVTLNVNAQPKIGVNPLTAKFTIQTDSKTSAPSPLSVTNTGSLTLHWKATTSAGWLTAQPTEGILDSLLSEPVLLRVNGTGLVPGAYTATLQIADPQASNVSQLVTVELNVTPSQLPTHAPAGQCGLTGFEAAALLLLVRRRRSKAAGDRP